MTIKQKFISQEFIIAKIPNDRQLILAELIPFSVALEKISILNRVLPRQKVWIVKVSDSSQKFYPKIPIQTLVYDAETGELICWEGHFY
ncbi:hypothetical protein AB0756_39575 [Tolypothrix campylonemoides VB511288_2]|uniref:Uncharacterized protein n=2 Tax=Nostocales TaxID=1161 RepID=A0ABW8WJY3_9CYAN